MMDEVGGKRVEDGEGGNILGGLGRWGGLKRIKG